MKPGAELPIQVEILVSPRGEVSVTALAEELIPVLVSLGMTPEAATAAPAPQEGR